MPIDPRQSFSKTKAESRRPAPQTPAFAVPETRIVEG